MRTLISLHNFNSRSCKVATRFQRCSVSQLYHIQISSGSR